MGDLPLGGVESAALTQGIAFLYAQAGEVLRRRRAARDREPGGPPLPAAELPALEPPSTVFMPAERQAPAAPEAANQLADSLRQARREVSEYLASEDPGDSVTVLAAADRLRCLLEEVYGTRLTFVGEQRDDRPAPVTQVHAPQAGVVLSGSRVYGDVAGRDIRKK
jgi:hypothetical protein